MERGERLVKVGKCHQLGWTKGGMSAVCDARSKQCVCTSGAVTTKRVPTLHLSPLDRWETSVAPLRIQHNRLSVNFLIVACVHRRDCADSIFRRHYFYIIP